MMKIKKLLPYFLLMILSLFGFFIASKLAIDFVFNCLFDCPDGGAEGERKLYLILAGYTLFLLLMGSTAKWKFHLHSIGIVVSLLVVPVIVMTWWLW